MDENIDGTLRGRHVPQAGDIHVDEEGEWYHRGAKIVRDDIIRLFLEHLALRPDGSWWIEWRGTPCPIEAADTPFVVTRVDRDEGADTDDPVVLLSLKYHSGQVLLDPRSLVVGPDNILYCRVFEGRFPARFSRPAYYQLADWIVEDEESARFFLQLGSRRYGIGVAT